MAELTSLGAVIKATYESEPDTNAFTDAEKAKLAAINPESIGAVYDSVAAVEELNISPDITAIRTLGYYTPGDGIGDTYIRVDNEPTHWGKVQSADGQWWEITQDEGVWVVDRYLHPEDRVSIRAGDPWDQNPSRVTAAIQGVHDMAIDWWAGHYLRNPTIVWPGGTVAINDELFSEYFADVLWNMDSPQGFFNIKGNNTLFFLRGWSNRAAVRTSGLYSAISATYPVPKAVFRWELPRASSAVPIITGGVIIRGQSTNQDPIGVLLRRGTAVYADSIRVHGIKNTHFHMEHIQNTQFDNLVGYSGGFQVTEYGGSGHIPDGVSFSNTGAVVTASEPVFTSDHVGRWFGLENAGFVYRGNRLAFFSTIASVDSPTQATLTDTPQFDGSDRKGTFIAIRATTTAGSNLVTLSSVITEDLTGRYITIAGAGFDGKLGSSDLLTAVVLTHNGDAITLSHAARHSVTDAPVVNNPLMFIGLTAETLIHDTSAGRTDDVTFHDLQLESSDTPSVPLILSAASNLHMADGSKMHGAPPTTQNFGANFCCILYDFLNAVWLNGIYSHSGHSPVFGKHLFMGRQLNVDVQGRDVEHPSSNRRALVYLAPTQVEEGDEINIYFGPVKDKSMLQGQSLIRLAGAGDVSMIRGSSSTRFAADKIDANDVFPTEFGVAIADEFKLRGSEDYGLYGWGTEGFPSEDISDANEVRRSGLYRCNSADNTPATFGVLEVHSYGANQPPGSVIQRFTTTGTGVPGREWVRVYIPNQSAWTDWVALQRCDSGPTAGRTSGGLVGAFYFDTDLGKPIWWSGSGWVDATGSSV